MSNILDNYNQLKTQIQNHTIRYNLAYPIRLIAVSKTFPVSDIIKLHNTTNHRAFGENYALELYTKALELKKYNFEWHFIGNIQSNKIKYIASAASWVHSICSIQHAISLNEKRDPGLPKLNVLIQVNMSLDTNKHGLTDLAQIIELANITNQQKNLQLRGLMGMSGINTDINTKEKQFSQLKRLFETLKSQGFAKLDTLSMGMSDDFEIAIKSGANMLRIGSLIFGKRQ